MRILSQFFAAPVLAFAGLLLLLAAPASAHDPEWSIAIHGGAGTMSPERMDAETRAEYEAALQAALDAGSKVLAEGGTAMDAVVAAITLMEDDPKFNAGRGAVFTWDGVNEHDASIMDGRTRDAGASTGTRNVRHPILLARAVMEDSPHVFLSREGAEQFAAEQGLELVDPAWFGTDSRREALERYKAAQMEEQGMSQLAIDTKFGTVGAVARDSNGNLAAGTSTGGMTGKRWGRIGDSPIIGSGTYADNRACAVSATGWGEYFIRTNVAAEICARMRMKGESAKVAGEAVIAEMGALGGNGGVIVAGANGDLAFAFDTTGMYRGRADSEGLNEVAIFAGEDGGEDD
ncbi:isoaspartyl peptidase/L-asparaginase [Blastomonas marina]|uniref:isoaspartyl peptidase/L-asparaginase family protein n=1 Tax=Blastomonas marina TaxID=1867408 RepID=UPI002AC95E9C|nr:isoaspartyl peptidase/L-asparaginase [Blastomonas marina]WPZ03162.1 isoaspartyl peptidase/L-asparaginase [Blastomonas marina]